MRNALTIAIAAVVVLGLTQGVAQAYTQAYTVSHSTQGVLFQEGAVAPVP